MRLLAKLTAKPLFTHQSFNTCSCAWSLPCPAGSGANGKSGAYSPRTHLLRKRTRMLSMDDLFKGRQFDREIIILCVRWYLRFKLSFRDLVEMMAERGISLAHTTIMRWIARYVPEFEKRWNRFACRVGTSWRVEKPHMRRLSQGMISRWHEQLFPVFQIQGLSLAARSGCRLTRSTSHSVVVRSDGQYPACCGWGSGERDHSTSRPIGPWFRAVRPPGSARTAQVLEDWRKRVASASGSFHNGPLDDDAGRDIFPQRHEKLARQRDDGRLFETAAVAPDPLMKPLGQRRVRLMAQP